MNQHKDLLYRQKYATYQLNNRTFSTQNTKISARSLAISYIYFQVRIVKEKKGGKPYYQLLRKIWWLPHPRQGLYTRNYTSYHSWRPSWTRRPLFAENSKASGGSAPWAPGRGFALHPARAPTAGPWTTPVWGARYATRTDFSAHPFFANPGSATVHIPPCSSKSLASRGVDPGGDGEQSPPPPMKIWGGGQTYRFAPPPNNFVKLNLKIDNM